MATTDVLLRAQRNGAQILHNGAPVTYDPRWKGDRKPWVYAAGGARVRYSAAQCVAYGAREETGGR